MGSLFSTYINDPEIILSKNKKNYDYYFGKDRLTHISRRHYSAYTKGYFYGYTYNEEGEGIEGEDYFIL
tara:strand:- start:315 stop:521 length:207 start_codon:yes stop_codon:yes gene_type:complete